MSVNPSSVQPPLHAPLRSTGASGNALGSSSSAHPGVGVAVGAGGVSVPVGVGAAMVSVADEVGPVGVVLGVGVAVATTAVAVGAGARLGQRSAPRLVPRLANSGSARGDAARANSATP